MHWIIIIHLLTCSLFLSSFTFCTLKTSSDNSKSVVNDSIPVIDSSLYQNIDSLTKALLKKAGVRVEKEGNYLEIKNRIIQKRASFLSQFNNSQDTVLIRQASEFVAQSLLNQLFPHWYGPPWDFNGYTAKPNEGTIACGYFVFTLLRDAGFNINRYNFSKKYSADAISDFCRGDTIITIYSQYGEDISDSILSILSDGLFIVGMANHIGFLLKVDGNLFFIHSNYMFPYCVVAELAKFSEAFKSTTIYVIGSVTGNRELIKKWILGEEIKVK